jgi:transcriptional regulator with XRE-family HTH domain
LDGYLMPAADLLDQLADDLPPPASPAGRATMAAVDHSKPQYQPIQRINYSHDGMINLILANRGISQNALAKHFGYSASWVSQVMSSDAFQARLLERATELEDPTLVASIEDGLKGMLTRSKEILMEKLSKPSAEVPDNLALRTLELATRALGYGARDPVVNVQVNMETHLEKLGENLVGLLSRKKAEAVTMVETE